MDNTDHRNLNTTNMQKSNMTSLQVRQQESEAERSKRRTIKKILLMSTMDKEVQKILLRILQGGQKNIAKYLENDRETILGYGDHILDQDNYAQLEKYLEELVVNPMAINDIYLSIIKFFVLSPIEKQYIIKIEKEIAEGESLDAEIMQVEKQIKEEKDRKIQEVR